MISTTLCLAGRVEQTSPYLCIWLFFTDEWPPLVYTWNPNDPCLGWKGPCFGGFNHQNRGLSQVPGRVALHVSTSATTFAAMEWKKMNEQLLPKNFMIPSLSANGWLLVWVGGLDSWDPRKWKELLLRGTVSLAIFKTINYQRIPQRHFSCHLYYQLSDQLLEHPLGACKVHYFFSEKHELLWRKRKKHQ